ncbi:MAG: hypothetical protein V2A76_00185 [Planctomycetota bacterium]
MKNLDFAKLTIWICLILTLVGVGGHYYLKSRIGQAEKDQMQALFFLSSISEARKDIRVLEDETDSDAYLAGKTDGRQLSFFSEMAKFAGMGQDPVVGENRDDTPPKAEGYQDTSRELSWGKVGRQKLRFKRDQIAKFIWKLEDRTNLLKVTHIKIETDAELRDDLWSLRLWVTERLPTTADAQ